MIKKQNIDTSPDDGQIKRIELFDLYKHYETVITNQLDFFFKYLNFYIGLLLALLAATITGLFSPNISYPLKYTLVLGPLLMIMLSFIGYKTVKVFYRRFIEAWITVLNIQTMLGLKDNLMFKEGLRPPLYRSIYGGGFITEFERPEIRKKLAQAKEKKWTAEKVLDEVLKLGDTLNYAKAAFIGFSMVAVALIVITIQ